MYVHGTFLILIGFVVPADLQLVLVDTGTGLAPYMSMLLTQSMCGCGTRRIAVLRGARHSWELSYRNNLAISRSDDEHESWVGETGHLQDLWQRKPLIAKWGHLTPSDSHVFLCSTPAVIEATLSILVAEEFSKHTNRKPSQNHLEHFWKYA